MRAYVIRRVLLVVPTLLILSMIVFLLVRFIPGDVIDAMQADFAFTAGEIDREALERKLGLDQPIPVQYARPRNFSEPTSCFGRLWSSSHMG